jgi:hypothetical protein
MVITGKPYRLLQKSDSYQIDDSEISALPGNKEDLYKKKIEQWRIHLVQQAVVVDPLTKIEIRGGKSLG